MTARAWKDRFDRQLGGLTRNDAVWLRGSLPDRLADSSLAGSLRGGPDCHNSSTGSAAHSNSLRNHTVPLFADRNKLWKRNLIYQIRSQQFCDDLCKEGTVWLRSELEWAGGTVDEL